MNKTALLVSTAVGLTLAAQSPAFALAKANHNGMLKRPMNAQHAPGAPAKPERGGLRPRHDGLKETAVFITSGRDQVSLPGGFSAIDSAVGPFHCSHACVVVTDTVADFASYYSYQQVSLCPIVDGYFTSGSCYLVPIPAGTGFVPIPLLTNIEVDGGTHMAQMYAYTVAPAYLGNRQTDYHVYKE